MAPGTSPQAKAAATLSAYLLQTINKAASSVRAGIVDSSEDKDDDSQPETIVNLLDFNDLEFDVSGPDGRELLQADGCFLHLNESFYTPYPSLVFEISRSETLHDKEKKMEVVWWI